MTQIKMAEQQFLGFAHASRGYSAKDLAKAMALTKNEWLKIREVVDLKPSDKDDIDKLFNLNQ